MERSFISEMNKMRRIEKILAKQDDVLNNILKDNLDVKEHLHEEIKERDSELEKVVSEVMDTHMLLEDVKDKLAEYETLDLSQLREEMVTIQDNLNHIKTNTNHKLLQLQEEESELFESIKPICEHLEEWNKPVMSIIENKNKTTKNSQTRTFVSDELAGWSAIDHDIFLKMRKKHTKIQDLLDILKKILNDKSEDEIIKHENSYKKFLEFKKKQKEEISRWREEKKNDEKIKENVQSENNGTIKITRKMNIEEVKLKIKTWKEEKERIAHQEKQLDLEELCKRKTQELTEKIKKEETKKEVEIWRLEKLAVEIERKITKEKMERQEKKIRSLQANKMIKEYRHLDEVHTKKLREVKLQSSESKKTINKIVAKKDPTRLLKPTKQWLSRITDDSDEKSTNNPSNIVSIPKLGIPSWRKDIL